MRTFDEPEDVDTQICGLCGEECTDYYQGLDINTDEDLLVCIDCINNPPEDE